MRMTTSSLCLRPAKRRGSPRLRQPASRISSSHCQHSLSFGAVRPHETTHGRLWPTYIRVHTANILVENGDAFVHHAFMSRNVERPWWYSIKVNHESGLSVQTLKALAWYIIVFVLYGGITRCLRCLAPRKSRRSQLRFPKVCIHIADRRHGPNPRVSIFGAWLLSGRCNNEPALRSPPRLKRIPHEHPSVCTRHKRASLPPSL